MAILREQSFRMPWGKYQGKQLDDIPRKYLRWLLEQDWIDQHDGMSDAVEEQLAIRDRSYYTF